MVDIDRTLKQQTRCNSPIPLTTVSLCSALYSLRKVGSSFVNRVSALMKFSPFFGSRHFNDIEMTGSGICMASWRKNKIPYNENTLLTQCGCKFGSEQKVSPEWQSRPNVAQMSPAYAISISSMLLACILTKRWILTLRPSREAYTTSPFLTFPW